MEAEGYAGHFFWWGSTGTVSNLTSGTILNAELVGKHHERLDLTTEAWRSCLIAYLGNKIMNN